MDLTGKPLLVLLGVVCVGAPAALLFLWSRVRGVTAARMAQRAAMVVVCQVAAVAFAGVGLNDYFALYDSWDDLVGGTGVEAVGGTALDGGQADQGPVTDAGDVRGAGNHAASGTQVFSRDGVGPASGVRSRYWVVLPPGYDAPENASRRYPLVEFLPGYPGTPGTWLRALNLADEMNRLISAGRVQPFVAVLPYITLTPPRDTECTNVPQGVAVATWLAQDVPDLVARSVRIRPAAQGWGAIGYSTGGFCATKLAFQYPGRFHAAASLSGYYSVATDDSTQDLFTGNIDLQHANSPLWMAQNGKAPGVDVLTVASEKDRLSWASTQKFVQAAQPPLSVDTLFFASGGHNTRVWNAVLPQSLEWLLKHVDTKPAAAAPRRTGTHTIKPKVLATPAPQVRQNLRPPALH